MPYFAFRCTNCNAYDERYQNVRKCYMCGKHALVRAKHPGNKEAMKQAAKEWLTARDIIAKALMEMSRMDKAIAEQYAAAILARLASNRPPLILEFLDR